MDDFISKAELARLLGVAPSSVTRWAQAKRLRTVKGQVPREEAERLLAEKRQYDAQHSDLLAGLDRLAERTGALSGSFLKQAVALCAEVTRLAEAWHARAAEGAGTEGSQEISATLRARIAEIAGLHDSLHVLETIQGLMPTLLPASPRRALFDLAVTTGGMSPERARELIEGMDDETVASKLAEWPAITKEATKEPA